MAAIRRLPPGAVGRAAGRARPGRRPRRATPRPGRRAAARTSVRSRRLATSPSGAPGSSTTASPASAERWKVPLAGETTISQVGVVSITEASPCLAQNARASSSWSGVFRANVSTPGSARLAMPVRVPAGGISRSPVTPRSDMVSMQRSHRTGLRDLADDARASPRDRRGRPGRRGWRSAACAGRGSRRSGASVARWPTAGAMCSVWKAPATLSGTSRALAGGLSAKRLQAAPWCRRPRSGPARCRWPRRDPAPRSRRGPRRGRRRGRRSSRWPSPRPPRPSPCPARARAPWPARR